MNNPKFIVIHHSASSRDKTSIKNIDSWHKARAFPISLLGYYVGYHYVILGDGTAIQTRNDDEVGAHAREGDMNFKSIGICLTGNFENEEPTEEQLMVLNGLIADKMKAYNITKDKVISHNEIPYATACCGKNLIEWLKQFRNSAEGDVKARLLSLAEEFVNLIKQL